MNRKNARQDFSNDQIGDRDETHWLISISIDIRRCLFSLTIIQRKTKIDFHSEGNSSFHLKCNQF